MTTDTGAALGFKTSSTVLATLLSIALVVPGNYLGMWAVWVYNFFTNWGMARAGYDGSSWIPFLDGLFALFWGILMPQGLQTLVAVGLSVFGSLFVFKRADPTSVAVSTAVLWSLLIVLFGIYMVSQDGWSIAVLAFAASIAGVALGAVAGRSAFLDGNK